MNSPAQNSKVPPNRCPSCDADVTAETSSWFGDIDCPSCGTKLWFLAAADSARFFDHATSTDLQNQAIEMIAERMELDKDALVANPKILDDIEADSLEALELLMDLEEGLGLV